MNLLDLFVKISCKDDASSKIGGIASSITGTMSKAAGVVSAVMGSAAVVGTVAIAKSALDAYSSYEQMVGGVETLFKQSAGTVEAYANDAYKTAGVSANKYMEQATAFSASLIQSLGGDTQKAADYANLAIMDMSDNANKMGTDIESIQMTYQSLMRGNYAMLDNLKLGYGGTKAELERLVSDAEKLTGQALDPSKFSDVITAIHAVQENLGITGTTAREAATTIEGSVNTMKAAWENWLTGLGNEQADMSVLTDQLVQSVVTAADNIIPRVGLIMGTLVDSIIQYGPSIASSLGSTILNGVVDSFNQMAAFVASGLNLPAPSIDVSQITGALDTVRSGVQWLIDTFSGPFSAAISAGGAIISAIASGFSTFGSNVQTMVLPVFNELAPVIQEFFNAIAQAQPILTLIADVLGTVLAAALSVALQLFGAAVQVVTSVITAINNLYNGISTFAAGVVTFFTVTVPAGIQALQAWFAALPGNVMAFLSGLLASVGAWAGSMASQAMNAGSQFLTNVINFFAQLPGNIASFLSSVISQLASWAGSMASQAISAGSNFLSGIVSKFGEAVSWFTGLPGRIVNALGNLGNLLVNAGKSIINGLWNGLKSAWDNVTGWFSNITSAIPKLKGPAPVDAKLLTNNGSLIIGGLLEGMEREWGKVEDFLSGRTAQIGGSFDLAYSGAGIAGPAYGATESRVYNLYIDGNMVGIDSRISKKIDDLVDDIIDEFDKK